MNGEISWFKVSMVGLIVLVLGVSIFFGVRYWIDNKEKEPGEDTLNQTEEKENVIAEINGEKVTKDMLFQELYNMDGEKVFSKMIDQMLIDQEAEKQNIVVTESEIEQEMERLSVDLAQINPYVLKKTAEMQLKVKKIFSSQLMFSEQDLMDYYIENQPFFFEPERIRLSHILVETRAEAEKLLEMIEEGQDFARLAYDYTIDTHSKDEGGDLGFVSRGTLDVNLEEEAFATGVGEVSGIIETDHGFHLVKVTDRKPSGLLSFSENKSLIEARMMDAKAKELYKPWIKERREQSEIKIDEAFSSQS